MKFFILVAVSIAVLAIEATANEYQLVGREESDSDYLERCKKSHEFVGHYKHKSGYGAHHHRPAYAPPAPAYAPPAPAYAPPPPAPAPAPIYAPPAQSLSYLAPAPKIPCSKAIVVSCAPSVAAVPCSAPPAPAAY